MGLVKIIEPCRLVPHDFMVSNLGLLLISCHSVIYLNRFPFLPLSVYSKILLFFLRLSFPGVGGIKKINEGSQA